MEIYEPWAVSIGLTKYENCDRINPILRKLAYKLKEKYPEGQGFAWAEECQVYNSLPYSVNLFASDAAGRIKPMYPFYNFIVEAVKEYGEDLGIDWNESSFIITEAWLNINHPGAYQEFHEHGQNHISGCYYVDVPENSGDFYIFNPLFSPVKPPLKKNANPDVIPIKPGNGQLVLFRSNWWHRVGQNRSDKDRISLAFNIEVFNV